MTLSRFTKQDYSHVAVIVAAVLVELIYISKGVLLMYRYSNPSKLCINHTIQPAEDDDALEFGKDEYGYDFTVLVYAICSVLRVLEYIPLFIGLWRYLDKTDRNRPHYNLPCKYYLRVILVITLVALSLSIPAVGVTLEGHCGDAKVMANVFIAYCCVNFLRYAWAFSVRLGMVVATLKVKNIWDNVLAGIKNTHEDTTVLLHGSLTDAYRKAGEEVKKIARIFETWFLFPWIIFFLASSLKAKNILSLWNEREDEVETLPLVYFMLYNINQMIFLIIPYVCAKKMNHYHHQCVQEFQKQQMNPERGEEFVAEQRKILLQVDENYDVEPHVWGLGFKVKMNSFIYIIFLVVGLVFTVFTPLL